MPEWGGTHKSQAHIGSFTTDRSNGPVAKWGSESIPAKSPRTWHPNVQAWKGRGQLDLLQLGLSAHLHLLDELLSSGAADERILSRYDTIQFENVEIKKIERDTEEGFNAVNSRERVWTGKKLVLANGVRDVSQISRDMESAGGEECCESVGVLAIGYMADTMSAIHVARMARRFARTVNIYTHGSQELTQALEKASHDTGFRIDSRPIARLVRGSVPSDVGVGFENGTQRMEGFLVHRPKTELNGPFAEQLGLHLTPDGDINTTEPFYSTSIPRVFAVGDCAMSSKAVVMAMSSGTLVAGGLARQLQSELYSGEQKPS
ncbi:Pyridine nucleotide-disulfide oxidoreductase class-II [Penicillium concentricum]|uniref:Pyridine nucleotide-disulfide oxidoreductase class-II n=1 Tax=Penicillium concentricum TaxID=293559 RepID=A0A9W9SB91_9EURO|nr:Pyridine nucleotide-disulfide oxidoreductase class-II [Penicillium concentricum]KAJ5374354.1 Pyridine nucleotide-disulfide oxidoreductase class-II [Penicillium concentricum]